MADMNEVSRHVIEEVAAERQRQIEEEGFDEDHDDAYHSRRELSLAAICYAAPEPVYTHQSTQYAHSFVDPWPWDQAWDKRQKHDQRRRLVIAAALLVADIERLDRERESAGIKR